MPIKNRVVFIRPVSELLKIQNLAYKDRSRGNHSLLDSSGMILVDFQKFPLIFRLWNFSLKHFGFQTYGIEWFNAYLSSCQFLIEFWKFFMRLEH